MVSSSVLSRVLMRELKFNRNSKIAVIMRSCRFLLERSMKILWRTFDNGWVVVGRNKV